MNKPLIFISIFFSLHFFFSFHLITISLIFHFIFFSFRFLFRYTSPPLALVSLGTLPPILLAARYFGRVIRDRQKHVQELLSQSTTVAEETFSNVRTVRQFAAEQHESLRYSKKVEETYNEAVAAGMAQAWFDGVVHTAANGAILGVLGYGGVMVLAGDISAGDLASFLLYSMLVAGNVSAMSSTYADVMKAGKSIFKRRRSNVAVTIVRVFFISLFLLYCLLCNHSFQTNPNCITKPL